MNDVDLRRQLTRVALAIPDSPMLAHEIVQEAYLRLLVSESGAVENPSSWLVTVTRNLALDQARRRLRERKLLLFLRYLDLLELHGDQHATISRLAEIVSCLIDVSDSHVTAILLLHIVFGMSYEDIATISGRSSAARRQAGHRALLNCRKAIHADESYDESSITDMYVHAIINATMAPLIDGLSVVAPVSMNSHAVAQSSRSCKDLPTTAGRARQVLVLTATGVKWALVIDSVVLCQFDNAQFFPIVNSITHIH